jgi:hypothetical protein
MADEAEPIGPEPREEPPPGPPKRNTFAYIVCSAVGRVGKTLTARLIIDYFLSDERPPRAFDSNHFDPELAGVFPNQTEVVDLTTTRGQMALFDALVEPDQAPKVVDLWHNSYELFFHKAQELEFFEEAWGRGVEPVVVLLADEKERFRRDIRTLAGGFRGIKIVLVHNQGTTRLGDEAVSPKPFTLAHSIIVLPDLDLVVRRAIDEGNILIDRLIRQPSSDVSFIIQSRIRVLLGPFFDQFESLERKLILENASFLG